MLGVMLSEMCTALLKAVVVGQGVVGLLDSSGFGICVAYNVLWAVRAAACAIAMTGDP